MKKFCNHMDYKWTIIIVNKNKYNFFMRIDCDVTSAYFVNVSLLIIFSCFFNILWIYFAIWFDIDFVVDLFCSLKLICFLCEWWFTLNVNVNINSCLVTLVCQKCLVWCSNVWTTNFTLWLRIANRWILIVFLFGFVFDFVFDFLFALLFQNRFTLLQNFEIETSTKIPWCW